MRLSPAQLLVLARLYAPQDPAVTPELMAAVAMVESSGNPSAIGDKGQAVGLGQFHPATWVRLMPKCSLEDRKKPGLAMKAIGKSLAEAAKRARRQGIEPAATVLANWHNQGRIRQAATGYSRKVVSRLK